MKARFNRLALVRSFVLAAAIVAAVLAALPATAAVYTWDNGTLGMGGPTDGSGTWIVATSANWWNGSGYQYWPNDTSTAQFGFLSGNSNPYTVTLDPAGVNAGGVIFQDQAYALIGSTLNLAAASGAPTITVNASAGTINSVIAGSTGLTKADPGLLTLGGANNYSGTTSVTGGTLALDFTQAGAPATNILNSASPVVFGVANSLGSPTTLSMIGGSTNSQSLGGVALSATSGLAVISVNGGTLNIGSLAWPTATAQANGAFAANGNYILFQVQNGGVLTTTASNDSNIPTLIAGRSYGGYGVFDSINGSANSYGFAYVTGGAIQATGTTAWLSSSSNTTNYALAASATCTNSNAAIGSLNISPTANGLGLVLNNGYYRVRGGIILQGSNNFTISAGPSGTSLQNPADEDLPIWVMGSGNLTLALPFADNSTTAGACSLTKLGTGTLIVTSSCTASGVTYLDQGTLQIGSGTATLPSGGLITAPGTSLVFTASNTFHTVISGSGQIISQPGAGNLVQLIQGPATLSGSITISSGSLQIGGNGATINGAVTNNNGPLILGGGVGLISLNSQPSNDNAGGTYINGSGNVAINTTLSLSGNNALAGSFYVGDNGGAGNVTVSGGTFNFGSYLEIGRLFGSTASNSTTSTLTITGAGTVVNSDTAGSSHVQIGWGNTSGGVATGNLIVENGAKFSTSNQAIGIGCSTNSTTGGNGVGSVTVGSNSSDTALVNTGSANFVVGGDPANAAANPIAALTVNGGTVSCEDLRVSYGTGMIAQYGGLVKWTGAVRLGTNTGSVASYTMNGGVLQNSATSSTGYVNNSMQFSVGEAGKGVFNLNGGTVSLSNPGNVATTDIYVGGYNGGSGSGTLNINGGLLTTTMSNIYVGYSANSTGTINVSIGRVVNSGGLFLGNASGATGTLNLNGSVFQANSVINNGGTGNLYFSGGTLQISGNGGSIAAQNGGNLNLYVGSSGATIDTNGNSIQALVPFLMNASPDGGLIKLGAGALAINSTASSPSTYLGPTQVSGGTLLVTGGLTNTSSISVAPGATFGGDGATAAVTLSANGNLAPGYTILTATQVGTISPTALTSNGGILSFKLSNSAASGNDFIDVTDNVSLTNVTFNISNLLNGALQSGSYELLSYGSTTALSNLHLSGLPLSRQTYSLDTTSVPDEILLDVSAASPANLVWLGTSGGTWDTTTQNWYNTSAGSLDKFYNLDNVSFTDQGAAHGNISIASSYSIGALNVSLTSAASSYTFSGPGYLMGVAGLVMTGSGSLTINTPNNLTGETDLHGGNVVINSGGALGDSSGLNATYIGGPSIGDSATVALHTGGTLSGTTIVLGNAAGSTGALTQNGGLVSLTGTGGLVIGSSGNATFSQSGGAVSVPNDEVYLGAASGASGTYNLSGGTLNSIGLRVGANADGLGGSGTYTQTGGSVNLSSRLRIAEGPNSTGLVGVSGGTLNLGARAYIGEMGSGTLNLSGNGLMNVGTDVELGMPVDNTSMPGSGVLNVSGNAVLNITGEMGVGRGGGTGLVTIAGNASVTVGSTIDLGDSNNNSIAPNVNYGTSSGTLVQTGGTLTGKSGAQLWVGQYDVPNVNSGVYNFSGGVLNLSNLLVVGNNGGTGVVTMSGSAILNSSSNIYIGGNTGLYSGGGAGEYNFSAGTLTAVDIRAGVTGSGTYTQTSGVATLSGSFRLAEATAATGLANISGGTLNVAGFADIGEEGSGTLNVSGNALLNVGANLRIGQPADNTASPGSGLVNLTNASTGSIAAINVVGRTNVGGGGGTGVLNIGGNVMLSVTGSTYSDAVAIGDSTVASGTISTYGTLSMNGGTLNAYNQFWVSNGALGNGVFNLSAGVFNANNWIAVGRNGGTGTFTMTGGTVNKTGSGNIIVAAEGGFGVWNMNAGLVTNNSELILGETSNTGTLYLNGGTVQATQITNNGGSSAGDLFFNGGVLQATGSGGSWFSNAAVMAYAQTGGAIIDSNGFNITIGDNIVPDPGLPYGAVDGGVTKLNAGRLTLSGANTYAGGTIVSGGTLRAGNNSALGAATGPLTVNSSVLDLDGYSPTVGALTGNSFALITNSSTAATVGTLTVSLSAGATSTYNGTIADGASPVALEVTSGSLTLSGSGAYTGGTFVEGTGTLIVTNNEAIYDGTNLYIGTPGYFPPTFGGVTPSGAAIQTDSAPVPEPGTLALVAATAVLAIGFRRRKWTELKAYS